MQAKAFSIDLLATIAVAGALIIGEYVEASVLAFLFIFGAWLEARASEKTRRPLRDPINMAPAEARVIRNGETLTVPVDDIAEGEIEVIHSGGKIPADAALVCGRGLLNEAAITCESVPVPKAVGAIFYSGTILDTGFAQVRADQVGDGTTFAQDIELVDEAQETKTRAHRFLDRFANIYAPGIVVL